jgi:hypothetical protein
MRVEVFLVASAGGIWNGGAPPTCRVLILDLGHHLGSRT